MTGAPEPTESGDLRRGEEGRDVKRILYLSDLQWACAWYRCHAPGTALRGRGHEVRLQDTLEYEDIDWCDVLVVQRISEPKLADAFAYAKARGKLVVYDLDDDVWRVPAFNRASAHWDHARLSELGALLRAADRVTTSTEPLARLLRTYNRDVRIIPNMLPDEEWPASGKTVEHKAPIVIGWAGGTSHEQDLHMVDDIFEQLLVRHEDVEIHLAGADTSWVEPRDRLRLLDSVPLKGYASLLSGFDIAMAPLHDSLFNDSKSDLKVLEYGMVGLPVVASKVPAYSSSVRPGETGLLARNAKDWLKHLSALVEDGELRARLGAAGRAWAETRTIGRNISLWERAYDILG